MRIILTLAFGCAGIIAFELWRHDVPLTIIGFAAGAVLLAVLSLTVFIRGPRAHGRVPKTPATEALRHRRMYHDDSVIDTRRGKRR